MLFFGVLRIEFNIPDRKYYYFLKKIRKEELGYILI